MVIPRFTQKQKKDSFQNVVLLNKFLQNVVLPAIMRFAQQK